jgi:hypothetical protein
MVVSAPELNDLAAIFMRALAAEPAADGRPLPDPRGILRRARLRERLAEDQAKADRAARPVMIAGILGPFGAAVAVTALPAANGFVTLGVAALLGALAASLALGLVLGED